MVTTACCHRIGLVLVLAAVGAGSSGKIGGIAARRRVFPETRPELCATIISHETKKAPLSALYSVYDQLVNYLEGQVGPTGQPLRYELVWLDNGSPRASVSNFLNRQPQFEHKLLETVNVGLYGAMNRAWWGTEGCSAPLVLSVEDDWMPKRADRREQQWSNNHIASAAAVLAADTSIGGVRLKDDWTDELLTQKPWHYVPAIGEVELRDIRTSAAAGEGLRALSRLTETLRYRKQCLDLSSGMVWGSFTTAATVYDRIRLEERVGLLYGEPWDEMPWEYGEGNYAVRAGLPAVDQIGGGGLCTARLHLPDTCMAAGATRGTFYEDTEEENHLDEVVLENANRKRPRTREQNKPNGQLCHCVFEEQRQKTERNLADYTWFLWGTPLHPMNQSKLDL